MIEKFKKKVLNLFSSCKIDLLIRSLKNNKRKNCRKNSSNLNSDEMKVKELINDIMAEKEVSEEKDSLISYEGSYY